MGHLVVAINRHVRKQLIEQCRTKYVAPVENLNGFKDLKNMCCYTPYANLFS